MLTHDRGPQPPKGPEGPTEYDYHGRHFRLVPRPLHGWAVVERRRYLGVVEPAYTRVGDDGPRYAAKRVGEERVVADGWTDDWRLAVEWLVDEGPAEDGGRA